MIRKIVNIDKEKCNGCGLCVTACHEGAIELIDGRAVLISDEYCDGLGDCLPECPTGAIKIVEREAAEYNEELVEKRMAMMKKPVEENKEKMPCGCPGTMAKAIKRTAKNANLRIEDKDNKNNEKISIDSELQQWPVQIKLVNTKAPYLQDANLLIAGDCTAYAYGDFHKKFIKDRITLIGCPKLDDNEYYKEKIAEILKNNNIKSITVVRMEVPCCGGIVNAVKGAMLKSETIVPFNEVIISTDGRIK
ncbi:4Fe-4S dicluster domain-containing protein [Clostridium botulinum]|uniref:ATP-binding protein n=1 Tax=Clostridium botulinum TaxID=1491 RepID=UPI0001F84921|nr:4Fe-4S dicluster domain-containing protein [Clostridium botulinum]KEI85726.1 (Fe-S)-binding protein [Clostridium botulinum B2 275]KEJ03007.1 (Fe-S)-binding protein [Clostridium botulinum A2B3 87]NFB17026.1 4Fe-4S dicluster domain-containing protein [Clostridium botulinum]NFB67601.1 4Fe-4S dicluster domain-containing protein [Clostridium botulinum]NFB97170.1 4Fe-4S dicluster domain-containing protein [Clostridium botulinum]